MKFLLVQPPIEDFYITDIRTYPLGLLYVGTFLKQNGHEVMILDCLNKLRKKTIPLPPNFSYMKDIYNANETGPLKLFGAYYHFGISEEQILAKISSYSPDIIGISCNFTAYFPSTYTLIEHIKKCFPEIKIVIGGYHATVYKEVLEKNYHAIDLVISGAEEKNFLQALNLPVKKSLCFNELIPDRSLLTSKLYKIHRQNFTFITATRGCPRHCSFCTVHSMHGKNYVTRETNSLIAEMKDCYHNYGVRVFDFEDDNLSYDIAWFESLLDEITQTFPNKDIRLYAMNGISIEHLTENVLKKMWSAGFRNLNISLVSRSEQQKKQLSRPFYNKQFETVVETAKKIGFEITTYFILGLPGQTKEDIEKTINYLAGFDVLLTPSVFYPPPGTNLINELDKNYNLPENWMFCRSSVFPVETSFIKRSDLVHFFLLVRLLNFQRHLQKKYKLKSFDAKKIEEISKTTLNNLDLSAATEEGIGIAQLKHWFEFGEINRVYKK